MLLDPRLLRAIGDLALMLALILLLIGCLALTVFTLAEVALVQSGAAYAKLVACVVGLWVLMALIHLIGGPRNG